MNEATTNNDCEEILQLVSFNLEEEEYCIEILKVKEIIKIMKVTNLPNSPDFVEGVINLRGKIIPVVDLRKKLELPQAAHTANTRIIVVDIMNRTIGFIVDKVSEVLRIPTSILESPADLVVGINSEYINSIARYNDRLLILIEVEKVLNSLNKIEFDINKN